MVLVVMQIVTVYCVKLELLLHIDSSMIADNMLNLLDSKRKTVLFTSNSASVKLRTII